jgi:dTDP-4-dehydrorhamnose 3,5-epimerase
MKFTQLELPGVWLIAPDIHADGRGVFRRHFCAREFAAHGIVFTVLQGNISENPRPGTLRGFHYQASPHQEAKTLSCVSGALHNIVVDLRPDAPTFMKWVPVELSARDRCSLHVPAGCAVAWLTTAPDTAVHYYMSEFYVPAAARGIRYDDPAFDFRWPCPPEIVSDKDRSYPDFDAASLRGT